MRAKNAATGPHDAATHFFWAAAYCLLGLSAGRINRRESRPCRTARGSGGSASPNTVLYLNVPGYLAGRGRVLSLSDVPAAGRPRRRVGPVAGVVGPILFMSEWRAAVLQVSVPGGGHA